MATEPVISIPIDTDKLEHFIGLTKQYEETLKKIPGLWDAANTEQQGQLAAVMKMTAALMSQHQMMRNLNEDQTKHFGALSNTANVWHTIARSSTTLLGNVMKIGESLIKWGGLIGGTLLGGTLFGIDRLAEGAAGTRQRAMGLGLSTGQYQSWMLNFGRLGQQETVLDWVNQAETNVGSRQWAAFKQLAGFLHVSGAITGNTGVDALRLQEMLREYATRVPLAQLSLFAEKFGVPLDAETLRTYRTIGATPEWGQLNRRYGRDAAAFNFNAKAMQDFVTTIGEAEIKVKAVLVRGLSPLVGPLSQLAIAIANLIGAIGSAPAVRKGIEDLSKSIGGWAKELQAELKSGEFKKNLDEFFGTLIQDVKDLSKVIHEFVSWLNQQMPTFHQINEAVNHPGHALAQVLGVDSFSGWWNQQKARAAAVVGIGGWIESGIQSLFSGLGSNTGINAAVAKYHGDLGAAIASMQMPAGAFDKIYAKHPTDYMAYLPASAQAKTNAAMTAAAAVATAPTINLVITDRTAHGTAVTIGQLAPGAQ